MLGFSGALIVILAFLLVSSIKVVPEFQRGVVLTLGR